MAPFKSEFLSIMHDRGFIHQISDAQSLDAEMAKGSIAAYIGFDCTADSLHVGSLVPIMMLYWLQQTGHKPIVLMGSGTTRIGDPSGKDSSRKILTSKVIDANKNNIALSFAPFITFGSGKNDALMVDNADWLLGLNYVDFLREVGQHFSVNQMIQRESVKVRLARESHLSFLEFNYMVLQAYDFTQLYVREKCVLQLGGSDQWGNIVSGIELGRRTHGVQLFGLTSPLITTASGAKMGKTDHGAIWLSKHHLSSFDYWQFWRNTEDTDVGRFLRLFTALSLDEIKKLEALEGAEINEAKKILANEATKMLHGADESEKAAQTAQQTFETSGVSDHLPTIMVDKHALDAGINVLDAFVQTGLANSKGEARRHIQGKALRLNDRLIDDDKERISRTDITDQGLIKLSMGKKRHALIKPQD